MLGSGDQLPVEKITAADLRTKIAPAVRQATKDSYAPAREEAVVALGKIADASRTDLYESIRAIVMDREWEVRASGCIGLGMLGSAEGLPLLSSIMKNDPAGRRLVGSGSHDFSVKERSFAAIGIALIGIESGVDPAVIEDLLLTARTNSTHPDVRVFPALALGAIHAYAAAPELKKIAFDADAPEVVRAHAIVALGKLGDRSSVSVLAREGLVDRSAHVQRSAAIALGLLTDREDQRTVETLVLNAKSASDRAVRNFCMIALGQIGNRLGRDHLVSALRHGSQHDRTFAAMGLAIFASKNEDSRKDIGKALLDVFLEARAETERAAFAIALGVTDYKPASDAIFAAFKAAASPELKGHLAIATGLLGDRRAAPILQDLVLHSSDAGLLMRSGVALGLVGDASAAKDLVKVFQAGGSNPASLSGGAIGLGLLGDRSVVGDLTKTLAAADPSHDFARTYAALALGILADKRDHRTLAVIQENCNYLATTEFLPELLAIY
jgi:HEAT repeat protein